MRRSIERGFAHESSELCGRDVIAGITCRFEIGIIMKEGENQETWHDLLKRWGKMRRKSPEPGEVHFVVIVRFNCFKRLRASISVCAVLAVSLVWVQIQNIRKPLIRQASS